jgi:hypothetical protein
MGAQFSCFLMFFFWFLRFLCFGGHLKNNSFTCMGAQFSKTRSIILRFFDILGNAKKHVFTCLSFSCFFTIFDAFLEASGFFLASFWSLCRLFGFLVSSFWVPLARLGSLWILSDTFCGAFGLSGLSVGSGTAPGSFFA